MKTHKVLELNEKGMHIVCIYHSTTNRNPYKVYRKWYDKGWHRKKLTEYQDFSSVLAELLQVVYGISFL